jgi:transposase
MELAALDTAVRDYVNDYIKQIETGCEQRIRELQKNFEARIKESEHKYLVLQERYDLLLYKRFARSAEQMRSDTGQQLLFAAEEETAGKAAEEETEHETIKSYTRKKPGRRPLDPNLPRVERIVDIPESEKTCACGAELTRIGEETCEKLHVIPQRIFVEKIIRPKYACRCCEGTEDEGSPPVHIAPPEPSIIPKSIAAPDLLSCILIQKFEDHLPYYRQEKQFERIGVAISRQDMSNWQQRAHQKLQPLFALLKETVKSGPVMRMDETTVQVMGKRGVRTRRKATCGAPSAARRGRRPSCTSTMRPAPSATRKHFWKGTRDTCRPTGMKVMTRR